MPQEAEQDYEVELTKPLKDEITNNVNTQMADEGFDMWFACDECNNPIPVGRYHYDCQQCANFTFCERCYRKNKTHTCKFTKGKVKQGEGPPDNSKDLIKQAYLLCAECNESLINASKSVYYCKETFDISSGQAQFWCKNCKEKTEHEHKLSKVKGNSLASLFGVEGLKDEENQESGKYLDSLFEDYHNLDTNEN